MPLDAYQALRAVPLLAFSLPLCGAPSAVPPDARYKVEVLAEGMPQPMELEFAPDGRHLFVVNGYNTVYALRFNDLGN